MENDSLNIALLTCDWRDDFRQSFSDFTDKLKRDHLEPDKNNFLVLAWTRAKSYHQKRSQFFTIHLSVSRIVVKPLLDLLSVFVYPWQVYRSGYKPDVVVVYDFGLAPAAWVTKICCGGKVALYCNHMPRMCARVRTMGRIKWFYAYITEKIFRRFVDHFFTINETMKGYLVDLGISPKDVSIFTVNTIERDATYIARHTKHYIHNKHQLTFDSKIILSVARLEAEKNIDTLLKLFAGLDQSYVLCIVGRGSLETELKHLAETLGISDRVYFEGSVPRDLIWNYYADADVFVLLSKTEALGIVFWEAIHMDVPVIGSRVGGIIETMGENEDRGFLWKKEDGVKDWISKVESCVRSSPEVESMKRRAKDYVFDRLSNMTNINQIIKPNRDGQFKT